MMLQMTRPSQEYSSPVPQAIREMYIARERDELLALTERLKLLLSAASAAAIAIDNWGDLGKHWDETFEKRMKQL